MNKLHSPFGSFYAHEVDFVSEVICVSHQPIECRDTTHYYSLFVRLNDSKRTIKPIRRGTEKEALETRRSLLAAIDKQLRSNK